MFGKPVFHDSSLNRDRMYCGDWWRTDFFFNITIEELIGAKLLATDRVQQLIDIMQINITWRVNAISDGQRRRCQLLECLAEEKSVYIMDEITTDLDLYAREGLLRFLQKESEEKGATIFYATHIFDRLAEWATHILYFSKGRVTRCCSMADLTEYHALIAGGTRVPLYSLMKEWVFREYSAMSCDLSSEEPVRKHEGPVLQTQNLSYAYAGGSPQLKGMSFSYEQGARILVVGANGAGKSTLLSVLGGKRMVKRGFASVLGLDCFNDTSVGAHVSYCGDWWRTRLFSNLSIADLLGDVQHTDRCKHLATVLEIDFSWLINDISDGQRRRCQLLECLARPKEVYLMDEITSDLDLFAREGVLSFLRAECEIRGTTIFYCTHIFDHLEDWATHLLHLSDGDVKRSCRMDEVEEYTKLIADGNSTPLYTCMRNWIYAEYAESAGAAPWRKAHDTSDGRIPNLGLAGPMQLACA
jgi:CCR4-NOT complex subunit CAF16